MSDSGYRDDPDIASYTDAHVLPLLIEVHGLTGLRNQSNIAQGNADKFGCSANNRSSSVRAFRHSTTEGDASSRFTDTGFDTIGLVAASGIAFQANTNASHVGSLNCDHVLSLL
jgi:hypothetical protein